MKSLTPTTLASVLLLAGTALAFPVALKRDDTDTHIPVHTISEEVVPSKGLMCDHWHIINNTDSATAQVKCGQWLPDPSASETGPQEYRLRTVQIENNENGTLCANWHVESHDNTVEPVCGRYKYDAHWWEHHQHLLQQRAPKEWPIWRRYLESFETTTLPILATIGKPFMNGFARRDVHAVRIDPNGDKQANMNDLNPYERPGPFHLDRFIMYGYSDIPAQQAADQAKECEDHRTYMGWLGLYSKKCPDVPTFPSADEYPPWRRDTSTLTGPSLERRGLKTHLKHFFHRHPMLCLGLCGHKHKHKDSEADDFKEEGEQKKKQLAKEEEMAEKKKEYFDKLEPEEEDAENERRESTPPSIERRGPQTSPEKQEEEDWEEEKRLKKLELQKEKEMAEKKKKYFDKLEPDEDDAQNERRDPMPSTVERRGIRNYLKQFCRDNPKLGLGLCPHWHKGPDAQELGEYGRHRQAEKKQKAEDEKEMKEIEEGMREEALNQKKRDYSDKLEPVERDAQNERHDLTPPAVERRGLKHHLKHFFHKHPKLCLGLCTHSHKDGEADDEEEHKKHKHAKDEDEDEDEDEEEDEERDEKKRQEPDMQATAEAPNERRDLAPPAIEARGIKRFLKHFIQRHPRLCGPLGMCRKYTEQQLADMENKHESQLEAAREYYEQHLNARAEARAAPRARVHRSLFGGRLWPPGDDDLPAGERDPGKEEPKGDEGPDSLLEYRLDQLLYPPLCLLQNKYCRPVGMPKDQALRDYLENRDLEPNSKGASAGEPVKLLGRRQKFWLPPAVAKEGVDAESSSDAHLERRQRDYIPPKDAADTADGAIAFDAHKTQHKNAQKVADAQPAAFSKYPVVDAVMQGAMATQLAAEAATQAAAVKDAEASSSSDHDGESAAPGGIEPRQPLDVPPAAEEVAAVDALSKHGHHGSYHTGLYHAAPATAEINYSVNTAGTDTFLQRRRHTPTYHAPAATAEINYSVNTAGTDTFVQRRHHTPVYHAPAATAEIVHPTHDYVQFDVHSVRRKPVGTYYPPPDTPTRTAVADLPLEARQNVPQETKEVDAGEADVHLESRKRKTRIGVAPAATAVIGPSKVDGPTNENFLGMGEYRRDRIGADSGAAAEMVHPAEEGVNTEPLDRRQTSVTPSDASLKNPQLTFSQARGDFSPNPPTPAKARV